MLPPVALGTSDVARLGRFVAGTEQKDYRPSLPAEVPRAKARDTGVDFLDCAEVSQTSEPVVER